MHTPTALTSRALAPLAPLVCLVCLLLFATAPVQAADPEPVALTALAAPAETRDGFAVLVDGQAALPDRTLVTACLRFAGRICPESWGRSEVRDGRFQVRLGPFHRRNVLHGPYEATVFFSPTDQAPSIRALVQGAAAVRSACPFHYGTPAEVEDETRREKAYIRETLAHLKSSYQDLELKIPAFRAAEAKFKLEELVAWVTTWVKDLAEVEGRNTEWGPAALLAPRFPDSVEDLAALTRLLGYIFRQYVRELADKYACADALPRLPEPVPGLVLLAAECVQEVEIRAREIERREALAARPVGCFDLYRDLLEFEGLASELEARGRAGAARGLEAWEAGWRLRLDRLAGAGVRYRGNPMVAAFPEFESRWQELSDRLRAQLEKLCAGLKAGAAPEAAALADDRRRAGEARAYLTGVLLTDRAAARADVERDLKEARALAQELDERLAALGAEAGKSEWKTWGPGWGTRLAGLAGRLREYPNDARIRFFFPAATRSFRSAAECLQRAFDEGRQAAEGAASAKMAERLPYLKRTRDDIARRIEAELTSAGAGATDGR